MLAPDGSRQVRATVPPGLKPDDTFLIRLALPIRRDTIQKQYASPSGEFAPPYFATSLEDWLTPVPEAAVIQNSEHKNNKVKANDSSMLTPEENNQQKSSLNKMISSGMEGRDAEVERTVADDGRTSEKLVEIRDEKTEKSDDKGALKQKLLLVQVPQGMSEGSTMQVEVPGENRTILAQVPPGIKFFHLSYTPRQPAMLTASKPRKDTETSSHARSSSSKSQKLLLVRVPKGTPAGTTLHVSVPDEPGRLLAAKVPPGNVHEFHVSYEARPFRNRHSSRRTVESEPSQPATATYSHETQPEQKKQLFRQSQHILSQQRFAQSHDQQPSYQSGQALPQPPLPPVALEHYPQSQYVSYKAPRQLEPPAFRDPMLHQQEATPRNQLNGTGWGNFVLKQ